MKKNSLVCILLFVCLLAGCSKSDSAGGVLSNTSYYTEYNDGFGTVGIQFITYSNSTFDIYMTKYYDDQFFKVSGTFAASSVTISSRTCAGTPLVVMSSLTEGDSLSINWTLNSDSSTATGTMSKTRPVGFEDFTTATETCTPNSFF